MTVRYTQTDDNHTFNAPFGTFSLDSDTLRSIIESYVEDGLNKTRQDVCLEFGIEERELVFLLRNLPGGVTKSSPPVLPGELLELTDAQVFERQIAVRRQQLKDKSTQKQVKVLTEKLDKALDKVEMATALRDAIASTTQPVMSVKRHRSTSTTEGCAIFCLQDWHAGGTCEKNGDFAGFDKSIFDARIAEMTAEIENYTFTLRADVVQPILFFNGDLLDDIMSQMHKTQQLYQDVRGIEQIRLTAEAIVTLVNAATRRFPDRVVKIVALPGNHDRVTKSRDDDPERMAHWILWEIVRARLANLLSDGAISVTVPRSKTYLVHQHGPVRIIGHHGDTKAKAQAHVLRDAMHSAGYRIVVQGHTHQRLVREDNGYMEVVMPSLMGASPYSDEFGYATRPGQGVIEISNDKQKFKVNVRFMDL